MMFLLITLAALLSFAVARKIVKKEDFVHSTAASFQTLAEAIPQIVWIANAKGLTTYINKRWYEMTGTAQGGGLGTG